MPFLISQFVLIGFGLIGLLVFASSEVPMAIREIALNTRRDSHGSSYVLIKVLCVSLKIFAVLIWLLGVVAAGMIALGDTSLGPLFTGGL